MGKDEKDVAKKNSSKKSTNTKKSENETKTKAKATTSKAQNKKTESSVKDSKKEENKAKKVEVKKEVEKVEPKKEEKIEINTKKVSNVSSDKVVIFTIIGVCVLIALSVFGVVFYKSNYESVVSTKYGNVSKAEYTVYYKMFAPMLEYYGYSASSIPQTIAKKAGTDKIILSKAKEVGIELSAEELAEIEETFSDKDQIKAWQDSEINVDILRRLFEEDYMITAYIKKIADDATDEDMLNYLKDTYGESADLYEYNSRHILIRTQTTDSEGNSTEMSEQEKATALQKAYSILARVKAGEDFGALAKELSEDTGTAVNDGVFKFYDGDSIMEEYEKAAKSLSDGQIYDGVVETSAGYHIIKLDSKTENGRVNSSTERTYYANDYVSKMADEDQVDVKTDVLNALVESLTGKKVEEETEPEQEEQQEENVVEVNQTTLEE